MTLVKSWHQVGIQVIPNTCYSSTDVYKCFPNSSNLDSLEITPAPYPQVFAFY